MHLLKRFISSTPVVLIFGLTVIVIGFLLIFTVLSAIVYYFEIAASVGCIFLIVLLIFQYVKFRKPYLELYDWTPDSQKEIQKQKKLMNKKLWNEEFKLITFSGLFVAITTVTNYWYGVVTAPIIFFIYGFYCIVILFLMWKGRIGDENSALAKSRTPELKNQLGIPRTLINYAVILSLISAFWFFQIQKNESQLKQDGYSILNEVSELRYCQDYQSRCVSIDGIKSVNFKKVDAADGPGKVWEMCFSANYEYSKFGGYYESDYRYEDFCFSNEYYGNSWGQSDIESGIYTRLKQIGN
jgi:hypothetical protein